MFNIVSKEIGEVFEIGLYLEEAKILVSKWEDSDKVEVIYIPEFYEIKEDNKEEN